MRIGIRKLRDSLTSVIRRVRAGETIEATQDGVPVALITPVPENRLDRLIAAGAVTPPSRPLLPLPPRLKARGSRTSEAILAEDRGD